MPILAAGLVCKLVTVAAVSGVATFSGLTLNNAANGYTLQASSGGLTATTNLFNVTPLPPPPPTISAESVVFNQKINKKTHKPKGPKTLAGYTITFDTAMDQTALGNGGNYVVAVDVIKNQKVKVGKKTVIKKVMVLQADRIPRDQRDEQLRQAHTGGQTDVSRRAGSSRSWPQDWTIRPALSWPRMGFSPSPRAAKGSAKPSPPRNLTVGQALKATTG